MAMAVVVAVKKEKKKTTEWEVQLFSGDTLAAVPLCKVWVPPARTFRFYFYFFLQLCMITHACMHALESKKESNLTHLFA